MREGAVPRQSLKQLFLLTAINTGEIDPSLPGPDQQAGFRHHPNTAYEFVVLCIDKNTGMLWSRMAIRMGTHGDNDFLGLSDYRRGTFILLVWFRRFVCFGLDGNKLWDDLDKRTLARASARVLTCGDDGKLVVATTRGNPPFRP